MNRRTVALLFSTLAALWLSWEFRLLRWVAHRNPGYAVGPPFVQGPIRWRRPRWSRPSDIGPPLKPPAPSPAGGAIGVEDVVWPLMLTEQALILLLGGGLLTWVVRRERRKKAAAWTRGAPGAEA